jgi:hypothetical protein
MKKIKNIMVSFIAIVLFTTLANAQSVIATAAQEPLTVKYIGNEEGFLLFKVAINLPGSNFSILKINDKADGEIYSNNIKNVVGVQTFKIEKREIQELRFTLYSGKKVFTKLFSTDIKNIEKITVTETEIVKN